MACKTPILIANNNIIPETINGVSTLRNGRRTNILFTAGFYGKTREDLISGFRVLKDCTYNYIEVPCGHCPDCIRARQNDVIQRCRYESENTYQFFCTLTYDNEHIPHYNVPADSDLDFAGLDITYADHHDLALLMKRLRNNKDSFKGRPFRYLAVSERGSLRGRPHFHILFFVPKRKDDTLFTATTIEMQMWSMIQRYWAKNIGTRKNPIYEPLFTYKKRRIGKKIYKNYDFHLLTPRTNVDDSSPYWYVCKYMLKDSTYDKYLYTTLIESGLSDEVCKYHIQQVRSRRFASVSFGLGFPEKSDDGLPSCNKTVIEESVKGFIAKSINEKKPYIFYYDTKGQSFPLAGYYVRKFVTCLDRMTMYYQDDHRGQTIDTIIHYNATPEEAYKTFKHYEDILQTMEEDFEPFDFECNDTC